MMLDGKGNATGILSSNGEIYIGDHVLYDDGCLTFTAQIIEDNGVCGFTYEGVFQHLLEFVQDMSVDKEKCDATMDFTIVNKDTL